MLVVTGIQDALTEGNMLSFLWDLASFIVALGVLITVHEFGHFWVARRCGVRVERFSIGFGKALWRRTDKLGTESAASSAEKHRRRRYESAAGY